MRVVICADMEGLAGVDRVEHCFPSFAGPYRHGVRMLVADVRSAVTGAVEGGASEVALTDWHYLGRNLPQGAFPELPIRRLWQRGRPAIGPEGLGHPDAAVLVGMHAGAGNAQGFLSHTFWSGMALLLDGTPVSDSVMWALGLGAAGIPVVALSGDQRATEEAAPLMPGVHMVGMKAGTSRTSVLLRPPNDAREELAEVVGNALPARVEPLSWPFPSDATIRYGTREHADAAERGDVGERTGEREVTARVGSAHDLLPYLARGMMATPLGRPPALANRLFPTGGSAPARLLTRGLLGLTRRVEQHTVLAWGEESPGLYPAVGSSSSRG